MVAEPVDAEHPQPQGDEDECYTAAQVLGFVLDQAARYDPRHAHLYRTMSYDRVKEGVYLAQQLLKTHRELMGRYGRGARTGKRKHAQRVYDLLASSNEASLTLAIASLDAIYGVFPLSKRAQRIYDRLA